MTLNLRRFGRRLRRVARFNIVVQDDDKFLDDLVTLERRHQAAIYENRCLGFFKSARQRDADVGVLRFSGAVHDAAHHGQLHFFDAEYFVFHTGICSRK